MALASRTQRGRSIYDIVYRCGRLMYCWHMASHTSTTVCRWGGGRI